MPKISLDKKVKIDDYISKIETVTYELPDKIVYNGKVLSYDTYHKAYMDSETSIMAIDFLRERLSKLEKTAEDYKRWID